jgi:hypothetical protein
VRSKKLKLDQVRIDGDTQPRTDIDHGLVDEYAAAYTAGVELPAVIVFFDGANYWLADGFHRWWASRQAELKTISCEIRQGTQRDAQWFSYAANQTHGLRRTNADKAKAVKAALVHPCGAKLSDHQVAEYIGVSQPMVGKYRAELAATNKDYQSPARTGRDGRTTNTANIGKGKPRPPAPKPSEPEAKDEPEADACPNCGSTDRDEDGECAACHDPCDGNTPFNLAVALSRSENAIVADFATYPEEHQADFKAMLTRLAKDI